MAPILVEEGEVEGMLEVHAGGLELEVGWLALVAAVAILVLFFVPWATACWPYVRGYGRLADMGATSASASGAMSTDPVVADAEKARRDDLQRKAMAKSMAADNARAARAELDMLLAGGQTADSAEAAAAQARLAAAEEAEAEAVAQQAAAARRAAKLTALAYAETRKAAGRRIRDYNAAKRALALEPGGPAVANAGLHMAIKDAIPFYERTTSPRNAESDKRPGLAVKVSPRSPAVSARDRPNISGESEMQRYAYAAQLMPAGLNEPVTRGTIDPLGYAARLKKKAFTWISPRLSPQRSPEAREPGSMLVSGRRPMSRSQTSPGGLGSPSKGRKRAPPVFADLVLSQTGAETIPEQIRRAIVENSDAVLTYFKTLDPDGSGLITAYEFIKGMREMGLDAPKEVGAVFVALDADKSGALERHELEGLLARSMARQPKLDPITSKRINAVALRKKIVTRADGNLFSDFTLSTAAGAPSIPNQIRDALHRHKARTIEIFRQLDEDESGAVSAAEFTRALAQMGLAMPEAALTSVFASLDVDKSGAIEYLELDRLITRSIATAPKLSPLTDAAHQKVMARPKPRVTRRTVEGGLFQDFKLDSSKGAPTVPTQIRAALHARRARAVDLFRQFDTDNNGCISAAEFLTCMRNFGLTTMDNNLSAIFKVLDINGSGEVEISEFEKLLSTSLEKAPQLEPLTTKAHNAIMLRGQPEAKAAGGATTKKATPQSASKSPPKASPKAAKSPTKAGPSPPKAATKSLPAKSPPPSRRLPSPFRKSPKGQ